MLNRIDADWSCRRRVAVYRNTCTSREKYRDEDTYETKAQHSGDSGGVDERGRKTAVGMREK